MTETAAEIEKEKTGKDIGVEAEIGIEEEIVTVIETMITNEIENMGGRRTTGTGTGIEK